MLVVENPVFKSFAAGAISGVFSTVMFQPLDLVKTRLQDPEFNVQSKTGHSKPFKIVPVVTNIVQNEQMTGLWKGMTPSLARCVPGVGLYFSTLYILKSRWSAFTGRKFVSPLEAVALGVTARSFSGACLIPFTVLKTRYESGRYKYRSMFSALGMIYKAEGFRGLTGGLIPTLLRDAPFSGLYLMFYTQIKQGLPETWLQGNSASPVHFMCGITSGVLASLVTQPADVIKTKMQVHPEEFKNFKKVILHIHKKQGVKGFFSGLVPRMLRRTLMSAMAWTVYERITRGMGL